MVVLVASWLVLGACSSGDGEGQATTTVPDDHRRADHDTLDDRRADHGRDDVDVHDHHGARDDDVDVDDHHHDCPAPDRRDHHDHHRRGAGRRRPEPGLHLHDPGRRLAQRDRHQPR